MEGGRKGDTGTVSPQLHAYHNSMAAAPVSGLLRNDRLPDHASQTDTDFFAGESSSRKIEHVQDCG